MPPSYRASMFFLVILVMELSCAATVPRNYDPRLTDEVLMPPKKRPFCNSFTGCGRKRSPNAPGIPEQDLFKHKQYSDEENLAQLYEAENTIEDISRLFSEAKLWEAYQQASAEMMRRKQKENMYNQSPFQF